MAREIIVPIASSTPWISTSVVTMSALMLVIAFTIGNNGTSIPSEGIWSLQNESTSFEDDTSSVTLMPIAVLLLFSLIGIFLAGFGNPKASGGNKEAAVVVYPLGIQLVRRKAGSTKHVERVNFIAWDQVLDCVVVEHIKAWKVTSVVMLRLKSLSTSKEKDFALIEAFPGSVEMSYERCLDLRSRILSAITAETSTPKCNQKISKNSTSSRN